MSIPMVSSVRVISDASLAATLVMGVMPHRSAALVISPNCSQVTPPCSPSIHAASNPMGPRKSMMSLDCSPDMVVTNSLRCSFSLARFGLISTM